MRGHTHTLGKQIALFGDRHAPAFLFVKNAGAIAQMLLLDAQWNLQHLSGCIWNPWMRQEQRKHKGKRKA